MVTGHRIFFAIIESKNNLKNKKKKKKKKKKGKKRKKGKKKPVQKQNEEESLITFLCLLDCLHPSNLSISTSQASRQASKNTSIPPFQKTAS
jgi:hypothetical protein